MRYRSDKFENLTATIHQRARAISYIVSILIIFAVIFATWVIAPPVFASDLDDFETTATSENSDSGSEDQDESPGENDQSKEEDQDDQGDDFFSDFFWEMISALCEEAAMSFARVDGSLDADSNIQIRQVGDPTLPFFQIDTKYLHISPRITAVDQRFELGYGALGIEYRNTHFQEVYPDDDLFLSEYHFLFRFSRTGALEYGIGMGTITIRGNEEHTGCSVTYPIKFYPSPSLGIKFKPTYSSINDNYITDYDWSLILSQRYGSFELGYRYLEVNGVNLSGSYFGFALHY